MLQLLANASLSWLLLGAANDTPPNMGEQITSWISMAGSLGFAIWYARHVTVVTIPKINEDNNKLVTKLVDDFRAELKSTRDAHSQAMNDQREECRQEVSRLMSFLKVNPAPG